MGRNKRAGRGGGGRRAARKDEFRSDLLEKVDMTNPRFISYYKAQDILPEQEWDTFLESLRTPLPTTFRVAGSRQTAYTLNENIKNIYVPMLNDVVFEAQNIPPPVQIPWYPEGLAWQFNVSKKVLRRSPEFKKFHSFLVYETEVGNVSRQEGVSMIPPLLLQVEPHHRVMDMCAAPGSKTAQLLEALHAQDTLTSSSIPSGLLLANDSDHKRTHLLIHQSARLPSPALIVTNLDASIYPIIRIPSPTNPKKKEQLLFDRILCDVPCSGDGTLRKNVGIWKSWVPGDGNGLHSLQVRILQRAMKLLKDEGRIVYSTCSLNPVENEAVLAEALNSLVGQDFYIVDVTENLFGLVRRPGLTQWRPSVDRAGVRTFATYKEFLESDVEEALKSKLSEGHFVPANVGELNLSRCLRIYPHVQDTGGFFVAVLEKRAKPQPAAPVPRKREAEEGTEGNEAKRPRLEIEPVTASDAAPPTTMSIEVIPADVEMTGPKEGGPIDEVVEKTEPPEQGDPSFKENPYTFLSPTDPILISTIERLHLLPSFPSSNILVRNPAGDAVRSLYLANDIVKQIIQSTDYTRIRLSSAGTKVLVKQEAARGADAQYRILAEGLPVLFPYLEERTILRADLRVLRTLVESYYPLTASFEDEFRQVIESKVPGSYIVRFPAIEQDGIVLNHDLHLPVWKSNVSLTLMIDKKAKSALSLRLFGKDITTPPREKTKSAAAPVDVVIVAEGDTVPVANDNDNDEDAEGEIDEGGDAEVVVLEEPA